MKVVKEHRSREAQDEIALTTKLRAKYSEFHLLMAMSHSVSSRNSMISKFSFINRNIKLKGIEFSQYRYGIEEIVNNNNKLIN